MFAALAVEAKDKLGLWSSRVEGASGARFLFCYFCGENAVLCRSASRQPSLFKVKMAERGGGGLVREWCWQLGAGAAGSRGWVLTFVSLGRSSLGT